MMPNALLLAAADAHAAAPPPPVLSWPVWAAVMAAGFGLCVGLALCFYRLVRGPELTDRVLAADLLALHVVGLVITLTIYLGDLVFLDAALVVGILGFVSTVGFAQYIHATAPATPGDTTGGDA